MRDSPGLRCCFATLLGSACTAPPEPDFLELAPEQPVVPFVSVPPPPAHVEPDPRLRSVGPNPGCPSLQVFTDADDLCAHGIMPSQPYGRCQRLGDARKRAFERDGPEVDADVVRIAAIGGSAELFVQYRLSSNYSAHETVFLALRGANGYVLLSTVVDYSGHYVHVPQFERFVGDATSVEVQVQQTFYTPTGDGIDSKPHSVRCTLARDGGIRCNGECPNLAVPKPLPALDCAALGNVDGSDLPRSQFEPVIGEDWGEDDEWYQAFLAREWLGIGAAGSSPPYRFSEVGALTILEPIPGFWVLMHRQVPLVGSHREIRVGHRPDGLFVSSWTADGGDRIQRLNLATHELEPVLPGACGRHSPSGE
jgi:hypothetical protein